jgi:hypothetical protein
MGRPTGMIGVFQSDQHQGTIDLSSTFTHSLLEMATGRHGDGLIQRLRPDSEVGREARLAETGCG